MSSDSIFNPASIPEHESIVPGVVTRLPDFCAASPLFCFRLLEVEFENAGITADRHKTKWTISKLPQDVAWQLQDVIMAHPKYSVLKDAVIKRTSPSDVERVRRLFKYLSLGDRTPSALLQEMQQILGLSVISEEILREIWMQRLPTDVQAIVASARKSPLTVAASIADEMMIRLRPQVSVVARPPISTDITTLGDISRVIPCS
ncbi:unnamed protein product [Echinostoma caproni]|uniref:DUF7041 domain-containing protein n=1 Tax=Echinostoma caproni TaxID=27848 RepID=A0A183B5I1_9TREM|nr:unnamed protein product [Echinostoma caproni]